ncbi:hypothetical protein BRC82_05480 [Halobacteriales archaeon QS_1_67_19]|nr:MAG: hypothetical protein BRC82_05480 [Halobacteriales archaeon QS_1_67_19]
MDASALSRVLMFALSIGGGLLGWVALGPVGFLVGLSATLIVGLFALDARRERERRIDDLERRVTQLERRQSRVEGAENGDDYSPSSSSNSDK